MKFGFYTLGCKTNQFETQAMERLLLEKGHTVGDFSEPCDCYVINTCTVTAVADKKNRAVIRRCRREHPGAIVAVCGCYPQQATEAVRALGVDVIGGSGDRAGFVELLLKATHPDRREQVDRALGRRAFERLPAGGLQERTRAMLKVQDGCTNFCSYCIIPYTRGPIRSLPLPEAVEEAKELARRGYRELVLTGIEIAGWGKDLPGKPPLMELIEGICLAVPELRIRLGSLEPRIVTEEFAARLAKLPNLCNQFHLSMQSGCDTVLKRMNRRYDTGAYYACVALLREEFPGCAITTDMIVAFPGETEEEFRQSLAFAAKCGFADMHIFPYSRRPGTPADKLPGQHGNAVKEARSRAAMAVAARMNEEYRRGLVGKRQQVLFEEGREGLWWGHAANYMKVYARGEDLHNRLCTVTVTDLWQDGVIGTVEKQPS